MGNREGLEGLRNIADEFHRQGRDGDQHRKESEQNQNLNRSRQFMFAVHVPSLMIPCSQSSGKASF